jgi:catechol 2,3-dioxygenase-like lactoylglutathione lyase family enzyme
MPHEHPPVRVSPIFAVTDLRRALEHYTALGCVVSTYSDTYGFAARGGVELHLVVPEGGDPRCGPSSTYLLVPDVDALAAEWASGAETSTPEDMPWGLREARHVDPDGNLVRFGSRLPSPG